MIYSVLVYLSLMIICVLLSMPLTNPRTKNETKKRYFWSIVIIYVLVVGLRYGVGGDWFGHLSWYNHYAATHEFLIRDADVGYLFLNDIALYTNLGYPLIVITLTALFIYFLLKSIDYLYFLYPIYIFLFFCMFFTESMNVMRQSLAYFAWFCCYISVFKKEYKNAAVAGLIGFLFHQSSIIAVLYTPFLFYNPFRWKWLNMIIIISTFVAGEYLYSLIRPFIQIYISMSDTRFSSAVTDYGFLVFEDHARDWNREIAKYAYLGVCMFIIFYQDKLRKLYNHYKFEFFFSLFLVGEILQPIFIYNTLFERANYYFYLYRILILSFLIHALWKFPIFSRSLIVQKAIAIFICSIYFALFIKHIIEGKYLIYNNYLLN